MHVNNDVVREVAALIASKLARNDKLMRTPERRGTFGDLQQADAFVPNELNSARDSRRIEGTPKHAISDVSQDQLTPAQGTADDYRARVDVCLIWARGACSDEVRLACLTLASTWLKAAMDQDTSELPLAPRLAFDTGDTLD